MGVQKLINRVALSLLVFSCSSGWAAEHSAVALQFQRADGQFAVRGMPYDMLLHRDGLTLTGTGNTNSLRIKLLNSNIRSQAEAPTPAQVVYRNIYDGVDVIYYDNHGTLEYDLAVAAGHDPGRIAFTVEGATRLSIATDGALIANTLKGQMRLDAPVIYQTNARGLREAIAGGYALHGNRITFQIAAYDRSRTLVIDPVVSYSTYVGNSGDAMAASTADSSGDAYLVGRSAGLMLLEKLSPDGTTVLLRQTFGATSFSFTPEAIALGPSGKVYVAGYAGVGLPTTAGAYIGSVTSGQHAFVAVMDSGFNMLYCSYLAGTTSAFDQANSVAADSAGNAYITGYTNSSTFPVTSGVLQTSPGTSGAPGFVAKFNPTLSGNASLVYSTYFSGPTSSATPYAIAVDSTNNAYVTGFAGADFPVTASAFKYNGVGLGTAGIYVSKLNAAATALTYSAFLGPGQANGLALDSSGNAYITGYATVSDFPTTAGAYQTVYPGAFVTELNSTGTSLIYSTFLAGPSSALTNNVAAPQAIALVPGCASACTSYISGYTSATDFPVVNPIQSFDAGGNDAFIVELSGNGTAATYSTYLGGTSDESSQGQSHWPGIGVMSTGDAIIAGSTSSSNFPVTLTTTPVRSVYAARISAAAGSLGAASPTSLSFSNQTVSVPSTAQVVTLRNMGSSALSISSIVASGDYTQTNTCGATVAGGGSCTISVTFTPTSTSNPRTGTLTINGTIVVSLTGTGANGAYMNLSPVSLTFASQAVGSAAQSQTVTISNVGNQALTLGSGAYFMSGDFAQTNNCPASLAQNTSCTVSVSFLPTQVGQRTGSLFISTNSSSPNSTVALSGTGAAGTSALTLSGTGLIFNPQTVNVTSASQTITVSNTGNIPVTIFSAVATGDYLATGCIQTLSPGFTCGVRVTFTPTAAGTRTGAVTIADSTSASPHTFTLSGTGVAQAQTITITPSSLVFADQPVGQTTSRSLQIVVTNTGNFPVTFDRVVESGDFRITSNNCTTLSFRNPPATCSVNVVFTPTATGARTGSIVFTDTATGSPQTVSLSGNGLAVSDTATVSPASLNFSNQPVGLASSSQNVTITNTGNVTLNLATAVISGTAAGDYSQSNFCVPGSITPARTCSFSIAFTPTATGSRPATLTITDDAGTQTIALAGTGTAANVAIGFSPATMTFQAQATGTTSPNQSLTVANNGNEALSISNIVIAGNYILASNPCVTTIQPNNGCTIIANYIPTGAVGTQTGSITFTDNAGSGTQTVNLTGQNVATGPAIKLSPSGLAFNVLAVGSTSNSQFVSVSNTSAATVTGLSVGNPTGSDFSIASGSNNCGTSLTAGASCNFQVIFTPAAAGNRTSTITIANSAGNQTLNLAGFALASSPSAYVHDPNLVFPDQVIATTSNGQNITLTNNGDVPLTIASVTVTAGDFAIANNCPTTPSTLNAAGSCSITVTFTPTAAGNRTGTVTITDNAPGSPRTISLSGKGLTAAQALEIDRKAIVFPTESVGNTANAPNPQTVTLTNTGNSPVTISSITSSSTAFVVSNSCPISPSTLPPGPSGNTCTVSITFTPAKAGAATGTLTITDSAPGTAPKVTMSGTGIADVNTVSVTPASVAFIPQVVGTSSGFTQTVTVTNTGNTNITMTNATVTTGYSLSNGCNNATLTPASNCSISIGFTPAQAKVTTGTLTITDSATPGTQKINLTGTGIASSSEISLSQTALTFDQQVVGVASQPEAVYYFNQSNATVTLTNVVLTGADYSMSNGCTGSVSALSNCNIKITFKPTATGVRTGTVVITDSAPGSPRTITLTGTGVAAAAPQVTLSPTSLTFASQPVGSSSTAQNIGLTNSGEADLTLSGITITGANAGDYSQSNNCPATLTASFSCTIAVIFKPLATGTRTAAVSITDNAAGSPQTVALSGTATTGTSPQVTFTPPSLTFANVPLNTTSTAQTSTLQNTGAASLSISNIVASGTVAGDFTETNNCPATVAVNGTCTITVKFTPTATLNQTGAVTVTDNTASGSDLLALAGNGTAPEVNLSTTTLTFGNQAHGTTSAPKTVTVENSGSAALTISSIGATKDYNIVSNTCPSTLAPGGTCTFGVTFSPTVTGTDNGYVMIGDNAGDSPQFITLTGSGT